MHHPVEKPVMGSIRIFLLAFLGAGLLAGIPALAADAENAGILEIRDPSRFSRVIAISDTHARYKSVKNLLEAYGLIDAEAHWAGGNSLFIVVGDSINKGGQSVKLIDLWMQLQEEAEKAGGRLVHTLGNHEASLLSGDPEFLREHPELLNDLSRRGISLEEFLRPTGPTGKFLHAMPAGVRVGNVLFLHAGWLPKMSWPAFVSVVRVDLERGNYESKLLMGKKSVLNADRWATDPVVVERIGRRMKAMGLSTMVFGHDADAFGQTNRDKIASMEVFDKPGKGLRQLISIDTGMGKGKKVSRGRLLLFEKTWQMKDSDPPLNVQYTARKMRNWKKLRPCGALFSALYGD